MTELEEVHSVTGQCACGRVTYRCDIESEVALCSCGLCRRSSGAAYQGWVNGVRSSLNIGGMTKSWASTDHATRHFCAACGSTLFLYERDELEIVEIAAGTVDAPDGIASSRIAKAYRDQRPRWSSLAGDEA